MSLAICGDYIVKKIFTVRGERVMLDSELAALYRVSTKRLNEQVRRNERRFPADFMMQLTPEETESLRSQFATSKKGRGGRRYQPLVFTEKGVAMLSSGLNSETAILVNIETMRAFSRLRGILISHGDLAARLRALEKRYDRQFRMVFDAIREMTAVPPARPKEPIGFKIPESKKE